MAHDRHAFEEHSRADADHFMAVDLRGGETTMPIVAELYDYVIGVDCHAGTHTFCATRTTTGKVLDTATFPVPQAGIRRASNWMMRRTTGGRVLVAVEGCGSYGATLTVHLGDCDLECIEASALPKRQRGGRGKSDAIDAERIATATCAVDYGAVRRPRDGSGERKVLQLLMIARNQITRERTRSVNVLTDMLRTVDLGVDARKALAASTITTIAKMRARDESTASAFARAEARRLAKRIRQLDADLDDNRDAIGRIVTGSHPELLALTGVGPVVAAQVLIAWSHEGRVRSEAAFASLAGTCPIPASSGKIVRYRLNRGGDRQLNRAISTIVIVRMGRDVRTRAYVARHTAEGRGSKEVQRSLKRYVTWELFRTLHNPTAARTG